MATRAAEWLPAWRRAGWQLSPSLIAAAGVCAALLLLAITLHRPDLLALAAPLLATLVVRLRRLPDRAVSATLRAEASTLLEGQRTTVTLRVSVPAGADLVTATVVAAPWLAILGAGTRTVAAPAAGRSVRIDLPVHALRWSRTRSGSAIVHVSAAGGLLHRSAPARDSAVVIVPMREHFHAVDAFPHAAGVVGAHRTRRRGDGADFDGIREFVAGDRLKRINWPVSLRTGNLHVTTAAADRDAAIMIVVDSSIDVTARVVAPTGGSLDVAVHAAASLAEHYLRHGDRVGLLDHARPFRPLRPASGRRQLDRIIDALLDISPQPGGADPSLSRILSRVAPRATVMLLSPLVGAARPDRAADLARGGHTVLVVDTLGSEPPYDRTREWTELAWRMMLLQRSVDIDRLNRLGVPVVPWRGAGSLDQVLISLSRSAARVRVRR